MQHLGRVDLLAARKPSRCALGGLDRLTGGLLALLDLAGFCCRRNALGITGGLLLGALCIHLRKQSQALGFPHLCFSLVSGRPEFGLTLGSNHSVGLRERVASLLGAEVVGQVRIGRQLGLGGKDLAGSHQAVHDFQRAGSARIAARLMQYGQRGALVINGVESGIDSPRA